MRRYWINFKGEQSGPLSIEQLESMGIDKTAYVWHSGLDDWVKITKVPELNEMLERMTGAGGAPVTGGEVATPEMAVDQASETPADSAPQVPPMGGRPSGAMNNAMPHGGYRPQYEMGDYYAASQAVTETPKCPPTNLVWSILATLCCCMPLGVVGIIYAYLTKKNYKEGNYQKAEKYSEYGAWAVIGSIVLGLMTLPLSIYYSMLQSVG